MLVLTRADVERLLDMPALIDALEPAMAELSAGQCSVPRRVGAQVADSEGLLAAMPGYVPSADALVTKVVSLFPRNSGKGIPTHQAVIAAFDPGTGTPMALLDGTHITAVRTGACSALSARLLAREDASVLAVLGTGVQARTHAQAMVLVRDIREIRVAGRDRFKADELAGELSDSLGISTRASADYAGAADGAHIVCATTHSPEPVVRWDWLSPGAHVTSVGFAGREIDDETVRNALIAVEAREAALADYPAGSRDLLEPIERGVITREDIHTELGELVSGDRTGRESDSQVTLYKSVGVAVQDAVATALVVRAARMAGVGNTVDLT